MDWGKRIIIAFVVFVGLVTIMVTICMQQEVGLVASDYYKQEMVYQDQIDRINNYQHLTDKPSISVDRNSSEVMLKFPQSLISYIQNGEIEFFRPSSTDLDQTYILQLDESGEQRISISEFLKGRWKVKLYWQSNTNFRQYYNEVAINL